MSLLPAATEIVYALGLGDDLVGVSFECDEPPAARVEKTVVVGGRDTRGMSPREIDDYVRSRLAAGEDLCTRTPWRSWRRTSSSPRTCVGSARCRPATSTPR